MPDEFLGLSFEMQRLLPADDGQYYFRPDNAPLLALFRTLGIKCLRVGGNTADRPTVRFPATADIDSFFAFARQAGAFQFHAVSICRGAAGVAQPSWLHGLQAGSLRYSGPTRHRARN